MSNVIGPITQDDWMMMRSIVHNRPEMKKEPERFRDPLKWESEILLNIKKKYLTN